MDLQTPQTLKPAFSSFIDKCLARSTRVCSTLRFQSGRGVDAFELLFEPQFEWDNPGKYGKISNMGSDGVCRHFFMVDFQNGVAQKLCRIILFFYFWN